MSPPPLSFSVIIVKLPISFFDNQCIIFLLACNGRFIVSPIPCSYSQWRYRPVVTVLSAWHFRSARPLRWLLRFLVLAAQPPNIHCATGFSTPSITLLLNIFPVRFGFRNLQSYSLLYNPWLILKVSCSCVMNFRCLSCINIETSQIKRRGAVCILCK
jgi:hypothetical protein